MSERIASAVSGPATIPCVDEVVEPKLDRNYLRWTCATSDEVMRG